MAADTLLGGSTEGEPVATETPAVTPSAQTAQQGTQPAAVGEPAKATAPPAAIEVKLPEGVEVDPAWLAAVKGGAKDAATAQAIVDAHLAHAKTAEEHARAGMEQTIKGWTETIKADKEIGGANYDANVKQARQFMRRFGSESLSDFLDASGLGNHPDLVRFVVKAAKAIGEDRIAGTMPNGQAQTAEQSLRSMYPNSPELL